MARHGIQMLKQNWLRINPILELQLSSCAVVHHGVWTWCKTFCTIYSTRGRMFRDALSVGVCCDSDVWMGWRWLKVGWRYVEVLKSTLGLPTIVRSPGLALGLHHETWPQVFQRSRSPLQPLNHEKNLTSRISIRIPVSMMSLHVTHLMHWGNTVVFQRLSLHCEVSSERRV